MLPSPATRQSGRSTLHGRQRPHDGTAPSRRSFVLLALLGLAVAIALPPQIRAQTDATVVYLVRHAERAEDGTNDPPISQAGEARAALVAEMLRDAGITHVHTTDFKRTRSTGAPAAREVGIEMRLYDPRDLTGFARELHSTPGRHLVVGHSNTTPQLVEALGGDPGTPIEEMEYDRLYIVTLTDAGASTVLLRFGGRYEG